VGHFRYARHFALIAGFGILLAAISRLDLSNNLFVSFATYGALHAAALVLTLRSGQPIGRKCLFIAVAAILSVITFRLGILGWQLSRTHSVNAGLYMLLGFSAAVGAAAYAMSIRLFGFYALTLGSITGISVGCLLAQLASLWTASRWQVSGSWYFALVWWFAFSGGLWYCDRRLIAANPNCRAGAE
jgi:hypothetical protein